MDDENLEEEWEEDVKSWGVLNMAEQNTWMLIWGLCLFDLISKMRDLTSITCSIISICSDSISTFPHEKPITTGDRQEGIDDSLITDSHRVTRGFLCLPASSRDDLAK